jgi:hypothetical protein
VVARTEVGLPGNAGDSLLTASFRFESNRNKSMGILHCGQECSHPCSFRGITCGIPSRRSIAIKHILFGPANQKNRPTLIITLQMAFLYFAAISRTTMQYLKYSALQFPENRGQWANSLRIVELHKPAKWTDWNRSSRSRSNRKTIVIRCGSQVSWNKSFFTESQKPDSLRKSGRMWFNSYRNWFLGVSIVLTTAFSLASPTNLRDNTLFRTLKPIDLFRQTFSRVIIHSCHHSHLQLFIRAIIPSRRNSFKQQLVQQSFNQQSFIQSAIHSGNNSYRRQFSRASIHSGDNSVTSEFIQEMIHSERNPFRESLTQAIIHSGSDLFRNWVMREVTHSGRSSFR